MAIIDHLTSFFTKKSKECILNEKYAKEQGWDATLFGCKQINEQFIEKVKLFQIKYNLEPDGIVGPSTYRRKITDREAIYIDLQTKLSPVIYCNDKPTNINWNKVITFKDKDGFIAPEGSYGKLYTLKDKLNIKRDVNMFVIHHDVCLSSKTCFRVLKERNLSVHFLIDNDGTIYQTLDTKHIAWHAKGVNSNSVGVEISNAFYEKFNKTYEQIGLGKRPVITNSIVHGNKIENHLGYYPDQILALKALIQALNKGCGIKLQTPLDENNKLVYSVIKSVADGKYEGIVGHYHITSQKIDPVGIDFEDIIK